MLSRSCNKLRRCTIYSNIYYKRYCSNSSKSINEYEAVFYSRPFGLDLKYNEFNDEIIVSRAAWKDIKINSVLYKINDKPLKECITQAEENEEEEIDDDHNTFKSTIKYLQKCPLPTKIVFKLNDNKIDIESNEEEKNTNTFSSLMAPFLELPNKSFDAMNNEEFVNYLQINWIKQLKMYNKFNSNNVFKQKYSVFISLMDILARNIKSFNNIGNKLNTIPEFNGEELSKYTVNKDMIYSWIKGTTNTSNVPTISDEQMLINKVKSEITSILSSLDETNFEKIESKHLFQVLFSQLFFDQIISITEQKHEINKEYLHENKQNILGQLSKVVPTLKKLEVQNKVINVINKYFDKDFDFMNDENGDINKQSEYWFVVTLLNDILLFPINDNTKLLLVDDTINDLKELGDNTKYKYISKVNNIPVYPHTFKQINQIEDNEISIQVIGPTISLKQVIAQPSLRDRFNYFDTNLFEMKTLNEFIISKLDITGASERMQIESYLQQLPLNDLSASHLDIAMQTSVDDNEDNIDNLNIYIDQLSIWIYNIIEILRVDCNKEHELYNYLAHQRPKDLIKSDINKIKAFDNKQFVNFIAAKISEIGNEENECLQSVLRNKDGLLSILDKIEWEAEQFINASMDELLHIFIETNENINVYSTNNTDIHQSINWLHSILHNIERVNTPIFDEMMERRNILKHSLLDDDNENATENDICSDFIELKQSVDDKLSMEDNPEWIQYSDEIEKEFVTHFLNGKGFADHAEKFHSMSCLAKLKNGPMRKMEMCAKHRKRLMKTVNKWHEIQNIIKYGDKPYYRSNGYDRTSYPSFGQSYGEIGPNKSRDFDPQEDQTKATKMFYVPFVNYPDLYRFVRNRRFDPQKPLQTVQNPLKYAKTI